MRKKLSEDEIDKVVVAQAEDDSAWEEPIRVRKDKAASLSIPAELVERASFLAKLHREKGAKEWLTRIIRERVELEEIAFAEVKRDLKEKQSLSNKKKSSGRRIRRSMTASSVCFMLFGICAAADFCRSAFA